MFTTGRNIPNSILRAGSEAAPNDPDPAAHAKYPASSSRKETGKADARTHAKALAPRAQIEATSNGDPCRFVRGSNWVIAKNDVRILPRWEEKDTPRRGPCSSLGGIPSQIGQVTEPCCKKTGFRRPHDADARKIFVADHQVRCQVFRS